MIGEVAMDFRETEMMREAVVWWCVLAAAALGLIVPVLLLLRWLLAHRRADSVVDWGSRLDAMAKKMDAMQDLLKKTREEVVKNLEKNDEEVKPKKSDVTANQSSSESERGGHSHCDRCHAHYTSSYSRRRRHSSRMRDRRRDRRL